MLDVITRRGDLELTLQIGAEILGSEDPRNRGDHPEFIYLYICKVVCGTVWPNLIRAEVRAKFEGL